MPPVGTYTSSYRDLSDYNTVPNLWYDMIWYYMIWYDMIWYDMIWYDMIWYDMIWYDIYLLTAIGFSNGGSCSVRINTQTIHRTTQNKQYIEEHKYT